MVGLAGALVLNIGTLSPDWIEAMVLAGRAAKPRDPDRARSGRRRCDPLPDRHRARGCSPSSITSCAGTRPRSRRWSAPRRRCGGSSRSRRRRAAELAAGGRGRSDLVAVVTGPVDHVSDGARVLAVENGHELLGTVTGTGCMSTAITGAFLAAEPARRSTRQSRHSSPSASPARMPRPTRRARAPSTRPLRRALRPRSLHPRRARAIATGEASRARGGSRDCEGRGRGRRDRRAAAAEGRLDGRAGRARPLVRRAGRAPSSSTMTSRPRSPCAPTASTWAERRGRRARARRRSAARTFGVERRRGDRGGARGAGYVGAGPSGRRRPSPMPTRRSGSTACTRSAVRFRPGRGDRRHRRVQRPRLHQRRSVGVAVIRAAGQAAELMRLSDLGELGLLAELERRGSREDRERRGRARRRRRHAGRARRGRPLPARLDLVARSRLPRRRGQPQRPRRVRRRAEGLIVTLGAPPDAAVEDVLELYEGIAETGVAVVGGDTTRADASCSP